MENTEDELAAALATPAILTVAGGPVAVRLLTIAQLPTAARHATALFGDPGVRFDDDDFMLALEDRHVALMRDLVALVADVPDSATLPIADFMALFNKALELNADFFLLALKKVMATAGRQLGSTSSSASEATATTGPSN